MKLFKLMVREVLSNPLSDMIKMLMMNMQSSKGMCKR